MSYKYLNEQDLFYIQIRLKKNDTYKKINKDLNIFHKTSVR